MALPKVTINFNNGAIGTSKASPDGVFGLLISAIAVGTSFVLEQAYKIKSLRDLEDLGILGTVGVNYKLHKTVKEFYAEAGSGVELWVMGVAQSKALVDYFTDTASADCPARKLLDTATGKISCLCVGKSTFGTYTPTLSNGLDAEVTALLPVAQTFAEDYTNQKYTPFFTVVEGLAFNGVDTDLSDLTTVSYNRVGILLGDTETRTGATASNGSALGVFAGRLASNQVHVNIGKVKDGALKPLELYIKDTKVELYAIEALHDKGYITFRTHQGKSGYFFTDDPLACDTTDDYAFITRRRVIDKAFRLCYQTLVNYLLDEVQITSDGKLSPFYIKFLQGDVERVISQEMSAKGELSVDVTKKDDTGVKCFIDPDQNIVASSQLNVSVRVRPHGYNRFINVDLGFTVNT